MNNPPYILVDEMAAVTTAVKTELGLTVLNYQYGYVTELNETLNEYSKTAEFKALKFPLIWLAQPFTVKHDSIEHFGRATVDLFIFNKTDVNLKAADRMTNNFKPVIYPIYSELIEQISMHPEFMMQDDSAIRHETTDRYFWDGINPTMTDIVDWMYIKGIEIIIRNKC